MTKSNRIIPLEALRFLIMFQICLWHFDDCLDNMEAGYLGVEFFFILSGIFIYKSVLGGNSDGVISFTFKRVKKFYPAYVTAVVLAYGLFFHSQIRELFMINPIHECLRFCSQLLMIQNVGIIQGGVNLPLWFFSVYVYGGAFVYALTKYYTNISIRIVFPVISALFFSYVFKFQTGPGLELWSMAGPFPMPLMRGVVEIAFGVMTGYILFNYQEKIFSRSKLLDLLSVVSMVAYFSIVFGSDLDAPYSLLLIPVMIAGVMNPVSKIGRLLSQRLWLKLGSLTFDMFLIHWLLVMTIKPLGIRLDVSLETQLVVYILILIPVSIGFRYFVKMLNSIVAFIGNVIR